MFIFSELSTQKLERIIAFKVKLFAKLKFSLVKPFRDRINNVFNIYSPEDPAFSTES